MLVLWLRIPKNFFILLPMDYDVFISHASEDKEAVVRQLAAKLSERQVIVWYDEFTLAPGSSLRRSIDKGLAKSRFGLVVLSPSFFKKKWTNWELDGLVARQNSSENELIIPIWFNLTKEQLLEYSPPLADKVAITFNGDIESTVSRLLQVIKPGGSTLVVARDLLFKEDLNPPLVTDDWWLDVVEYSGKEYLHHDYLSFSIPWKGWEPIERGEYIAKHALQMLWQSEGNEINISQLTHPDKVLTFISEQPGLKKTVIDQPLKAAFFFPQLTIKGMGGFLEPIFDELINKPPKFGRHHLCEEEIALRHPSFGNYSNIELADFYFTGAGGGFGMSSSRHDHIDFLLWLLSEKSSWLPTQIRSKLLDGLKEWAVWGWSKGGSNYSDFEGGDDSGALQLALIKARKVESFKLSKKSKADLYERLEHSIRYLGLPENVQELFDRFFQEQVIDAFISKWSERSKRMKSK